MRVVRAKGQREYPNGNFMCTTASLMMCLAALCGGVEKKGLLRCMDAAMGIASVLHLRLTQELRHDLMSVYDIVRSRAFRIRSGDLAVEESMVMQGCHPDVQGACMDLNQALQRVCAQCAMVVTSSGHSVCVFMSGSTFHIFDPMGAECFVTADADQCLGLLRKAGRGQRDMPWRAPISAHGRALVDGQGRNFLLRCVNWYGLHMGRMKLMGPVPEIARKVADAGFNCVQLPFSTELVLRNQTAAMDEAVEELTGQGLAVILNSHTTRASWCCSYGDGNGMWNIKGDSTYTTEAWLSSLETLARRYESNKRVIGIDLKNEIHHTPDAKVTWGVSDNVDTDWKAASEEAARRIHAVDSDSLIFVQGLCYAVDPRPMYVDPPRFALSGTKLVFSVHMYPWSLPFSVAEGFFGHTAWIFLGAVMLLADAALLWWAIPRLRGMELVVTGQAVTVMLLLAAVTAAATVSIQRSVGCTIQEYEDAYLALVTCSALAVLLHGVYARAYQRDWSSAKRRNSLVLGAVAAAQPLVACLAIFMTVPAVREGLIYEQIQSRVTDPRRAAPLFLGEFGMANDVDEGASGYWAAIRRLVKSEGMGWAYWPLNRFMREGEIDTFGLLHGREYSWVERRLRALPW